MSQLRIIGFESGIFLLTQALALFVGIQMLGSLAMQGVAHEEVMIQSTGMGIGMFLAALLASTIFMILLIKYLDSRLLFQLMFGWLVFVGSFIVFQYTIGNPWAMTFAVFVVILRFLKPLVLLQNIAMILAIAGVAAQLGLVFSTITLVIVLIIASVYDYIAVFKTKHMITLFEGLLEHNVPFTVLIPDQGNMFQRMDADVHKRTERGREFYLLGTGDIAFPAIFAIAVLARYTPQIAVITIAGSLVGLLLDHYLLMKLQRPIPALPTIAGCTLIAFALSFLI